MKESYLALMKAVSSLTPELRNCLTELMNAGVKFVAGDWGRCPMTTLAFAKRDGECNVPLTLEKSNAKVDLAEELEANGGGDQTARELANILGTTLLTVQTFASAWDKHVDTVSKTFVRAFDVGLREEQDDDEREWSGQHLRWIRDSLKEDMRASAVQQAHHDLHYIIAIEQPPYIAPTHRFEVTLSTTINAVDVEAAQEAVESNIGASGVYIVNAIRDLDAPEDDENN